MKKFLGWALALALLCAPCAGFAQEALVLTATVEAAEEIALKAPASGELAPFQLRAGDALEAGQNALLVELVNAYAPADGVVADVYVRAGDIADAAVSRYGAALKLDYADRYQVSGSVRGSSNNVENRDLRVGTPVFLRSVNGDHFANGLIIEVNGQSFTAQVLGGDLVFTERVDVYRSEGYESNTRLASDASLSAVPPLAVTASGTIVSVAVAPGQAVRAGDLLFSYVPDELEPSRRGLENATSVAPDVACVVTGVSVQQGASVQKGQTLFTACPLGSYELVAMAEEGELTAIHTGDEAIARFEELGVAATATVTGVSWLGSDAGDVSEYAVYLSFEAVEGVRLGMHAVVEWP